MATYGSATGGKVPQSEFTYRSRDGLTLFGRAWGDPAAPGLPVVCLPGMTRNSKDFAPLAEHLARTRRVIALDLRGRGQSAYAAVATYNPGTEADDVVQALTALHIPRALFIGTSRGGLVMFVLAMTHPNLIGGAIFNDIGPVIESAGLARIASYIGKPVPASWADTVTRFKAEQGSQFPSLDATGWGRFARQVFREENGAPAIDYDPALEVAFRAFDPRIPLPTAWPAFDALSEVPVMVVHGGLSDILSGATVAEMQRRRPDLDLLTIPDEGHAPLLWDRTAQTRIATFLDRADPPAAPAPKGFIGRVITFFTRLKFRLT